MSRNIQQIFEHIFDRLYVGYGIHIKSREIIILFSEFLEHGCYTARHHCSRCVTYSIAGNFSAKNYKLSSHDSFLLTQETVYDNEDKVLVFSKHYIPAEVFELKFEI